jgi:hypothetical protein
VVLQEDWEPVLQDVSQRSTSYWIRNVKARDTILRDIFDIIFRFCNYRFWNVRSTSFIAVSKGCPAESWFYNVIDSFLHNYRWRPQLCCTQLRIKNFPHVKNRWDGDVISDSQSVWEVSYLVITLELASIWKYKYCSLLDP